MLPFERAPWIGAPTFDPPVLAGFTVPQSGQTPVRIAAADPRRWLLVVSQAGNSSVAFVYGPSKSITSSVGMLMIGAGTPIYLTFYNSGALVNQEWFAVSTSVQPGLCAVMTMSVVDWPVGDEHEPNDSMLVGTAPPRIELPPAPAANGRQSVLSYWRSLMSRITGKS